MDPAWALAWLRRSALAGRALFPFWLLWFRSVNNKTYAEFDTAQV